MISTHVMLAWPPPRVRNLFLTLHKTSFSFPTLLHAAVLPAFPHWTTKDSLYSTRFLMNRGCWSSRQCSWGSFLALSFAIAWWSQQKKSPSAMKNFNDLQQKGHLEFSVQQKIGTTWLSLDSGAPWVATAPIILKDLGFVVTKGYPSLGHQAKHKAWKCSSGLLSCPSSHWDLKPTAVQRGTDTHGAI